MPDQMGSTLPDIKGLQRHLRVPALGLIKVKERHVKLKCTMHHVS